MIFEKHFIMEIFQHRWKVKVGRRVRSPPRQWEQLSTHSPLTNVSPSLEISDILYFIWKCILVCVQNSSFSHRRSANRSGGWRGPLGGWREAQRGLVPLLGCCPAPSSSSWVHPEVPPGSKMQVLSSLLKAPSLLGCCRARHTAFTAPYAGLGRRRRPDVDCWTPVAEAHFCYKWSAWWWLKYSAKHFLFFSRFVSEFHPHFTLTLFPHIST